MVCESLKLRIVWTRSGGAQNEYYSMKHTNSINPGDFQVSLNYSNDLQSSHDITFQKDDGKLLLMVARRTGH